MSPSVNTVPGMPSSRLAVSVSPIVVLSAMSPAPTSTTGPAGAAWTATESEPVLAKTFVTVTRTLSRASAA